MSTAFTTSRTRPTIATARDVSTNIRIASKIFIHLTSRRLVSAYRAIAFSGSVAICRLPDSWGLTSSKLAQSLTESDWTQTSASIGHCLENAIALSLHTAACYQCSFSEKMTKISRLPTSTRKAPTAYGCGLGGVNQQYRPSERSPHLPPPRIRNGANCKIRR